MAYINFGPVDIMLEYKNAEKMVLFQGEARTAWGVFTVLKTAKITEKVPFFF